MPVQEELQGFGSWSLELSEITHSRIRLLRLWSTIYIVPTFIPGAVDIDLAEVKRRAIYAGVVTDKGSHGQGLQLNGHHISWWLGDVAREGPLTVNEVSHDGIPPTAVIRALWAEVNPPLPLGRVRNPPDTVPNPLFTGTIPKHSTVREVLDRIASECYCSWRVNVNGTVDFGDADTLYNTDDPVLIGRELQVRIAQGYAASALHTYTNGQALSQVIVDTQQGVAIATNTDIFMGYEETDYNRSKMVTTTTGGEASATELAKYLLNNRSRVQAGAEASFNNDELIDQVQVGDSILVYDPLIGWGSVDGTDVYFGSRNYVQPLVLGRKNWNVPEGYTVFCNPSGTTSIIDITLWLRTEQAELRLSMGDENTAFGYQVLGAEDGIAPNVDIFEER